MGFQDVMYTAVTMPFNVIHKTSAGAASYAWDAATSVSLWQCSMSSLIVLQNDRDPTPSLHLMSAVKPTSPR